MKLWAGQYFLGLSRTGDGIGFFLSFSARHHAAACPWADRRLFELARTFRLLIERSGVLLLFDVLFDFQETVFDVHLS